MANTVTIDQAYFETLLRRAQFHADGGAYTTPVNVPTVNIPKQDYDSLLDAARQYENLRRNLFLGGIAEETLAILIKDDTSTNQDVSTGQYSSPDVVADGGLFGTQTPLTTPGTDGKDYTFGRNANYSTRIGLRERDVNTNGFHSHSFDNEDGFMPDGPDGFYEGGSGNNDSQPRIPRQQFDKFAKRTVLLSNLPEGTTHSDIVDAVRGGMLLDIYLRTHDRAASVSFLEEVAAQDFFRHVKRHDLYIKSKRVDIKWNDRQFILPGHVANKIAIGATRNLVIHNRSPKHTEESIREDLDHIHNLVVIKIGFRGQNAYISLNSVHNAMFARTCMMSRSTYKGYKIEWDNDECAAPFEVPSQARKTSIPTKKKGVAPINRFQLLNLDGDENDSHEDERDSSGLTLSTAMSPSTVGIAA